MDKKQTFKVVIKSESDNKLGEAEFRMHKTYHVPVLNLPEVVAYLEQFKKK